MTTRACTAWLAMAAGLLGTAGLADAQVATIREATGPFAAALQATIDTFRADLGEPNNGGTSGSQGTGRREIDWDAVPDGDAAPGRLPADFFNVVSPRGVVFSAPPQADPLPSFMVSADSVNPSSTAVQFANLHATYAITFNVFSPQRLFTPLGTNVFDVTFFVPGTSDPAAVSGFGAVFTDVDESGTSRLEFYEGETMAFSRDLLASPGDESLSFLGVTFEAPTITRVRIHCGTAPLTVAASPDDTTRGGMADVVVLDDFLYGEPVALPTTTSTSSTTTTSTLAGGTTTSTTLGCGTTATFPTAVCRLDALVCTAQSGVVQASAARKLLVLLGKAKAKVQGAESASSERKAQRQLRGALKTLGAFDRRLTAKKVQSAAPSDVLQALAAEGSAVRALLEALQP